MKKLFLFSFLFYFFNTLLAQTIESISFVGLEQTKAFVLENELTIKVGDNLIRSDIDTILKQQASKIYNLQLFHWVKPSYNIDNNTISILFEVQERWYFWPVPILSLADRNFNSWWQKKDFGRLDYGLHLLHSNVFGLNNKFKANLQEGFNKKYEAFYTIPYINKKKNIGLGIGASHYRSHFLDIYLLKNKIQTKEFQSFPLIQNYVQSQVFYRKSVSEQLFLNISYHSQRISDSVLIENPKYFEESNNKYVISELNLLVNNRNNFSYPRTGHYYSLSLKSRLGLISREINQISIFGEFDKYSILKGRLLVANGITYQKQIGSNNYFYDQRALGYKKNIRGYEYYVIAGGSYFLNKNEVKYEIFQNKLVKFNFSQNKKFNTIPISTYFVTHFDLGYVEDSYGFQENTLANNWQYGYGFGIHFVAYYDKVFTLEYSINKLNEKGLFIGAKFPI